MLSLNLDRGVPIIGSGPMGVLNAPNLANSSAFSLPNMPVWPGTQTTFTVFDSANSFREFQHSSDNADVNLLDHNALIAA